MQVALNTLPLLSPLTGIGNYIWQLARRLPALAPNDDYVYFYGYFTRQLFTASQAGYRVKKSLTTLTFMTAAARTIIDWRSKFHRGTFDLYFEPNFIPLRIPARRTVTTLHDLVFMLHPEYQPKERMEHFRRRFERRISRSSRIITDSVYVREQAATLLQLPAVPVTPIHLGVEHDVFRLIDRQHLADFSSKLPSREPFILYVGTIEPRKNLPRLLQAYLDLPAYLKKAYTLVLVGFEGWRNREFDALVKQVGHRVIYLGYRSAEELACLYNLASVFVFPSLYEGFGLPPLEAMACGCPVVVSNVAALPEVCGDAAYYVDPNDTQSIAEGIAKVLTDGSLRQDLVERGLRRASAFTWEKTARETLQVFDQVLAEPPAKR